MNTDNLMTNDTLGGPDVRLTPATAHSAMFSDDSISPGQGSGTISFFEFITHNHSLLSLWFAGLDESPPVLLPCMCCGSVTKGVTRRHRLFIFFFVFVMVFFITLQVELAGHQGDAWLLIWLLCTFIVLPITCRLKSDLPVLSERLNERPVVAPLLVEEVVLAIFFLGSVIGGFASGGSEKTYGTLYHFTGSYAATLASELASLIWKYFFCRTCCICCLPPGEGDYAGKV